MRIGGGRCYTRNVNVLFAVNSNRGDLILYVGRVSHIKRRGGIGFRGIQHHYETMKLGLIGDLCLKGAWSGGETGSCISGDPGMSRVINGKGGNGHKSISTGADHGTVSDAAVRRVLSQLHVGK